MQVTHFFCEKFAIAKRAIAGSAMLRCHFSEVQVPLEAPLGAA